MVNSKDRKLLLFTLVLLLIYLLILISNRNTSYALEDLNVKGESDTTLVDISYNEYVITNKESVIYRDKDGKMFPIGKIQANVELSLDGIIDNYFLITNLDDIYYIKYTDVTKINTMSSEDDRFKKYIPFNKNVVTKQTTNLYDGKGNLIYTFNKSFEFPIILNKKDEYGVEYGSKLLYVKKDDILEEKNSVNTTDLNTNGIGVLNYHFFYDDSVQKEKEECNQVICASKTQFKEHLDYLKENNILTLTMEELEMYIDGVVRLPKSVVITIDDGWRAELGIEMLTEYEMNATMFLVTSLYDPKNFITDYVEVHSHSHNMHNQGDCPTGQGGGIQCLSKEFILNDLKTSSDKIGGSNVFCYPFYEYNDYSISMLKESGFTMAFAGESNYSDNLVKVGSNKYKLPRFVVVDYTTMDDFSSYVNNK